MLENTSAFPLSMNMALRKLIIAFQNKAGNGKSIRKTFVEILDEDTKQFQMVLPVVSS
jgi:hypothetical protein